MAGPISNTVQAPVDAEPRGVDDSQRRLIADAMRSSGRDDGRSKEFMRVRPREPHERYDVDPKLLKPGMDYRWVSLSCRGEPNPQLTDTFRSGWLPARAEDFPQHSGIDAYLNPMLVELGHQKQINPDDPVIDRNLMLCVRPMEFSDQSRREDEAAADKQVDDHMRHLNNQSRRAIGDKTRISRRVTRGVVPDGLIPDDADLEE
jgi:hypothetical protein